MHYLSISIYLMAIALGSKFLMAVAMGLTFWFFVVVKTSMEKDSIGE